MRWNVRNISPDAAAKAAALLPRYGTLGELVSAAILALDQVNQDRTRFLGGEPHSALKARLLDHFAEFDRAMRLVKQYLAKTGRSE